MEYFQGWIHLPSQKFWAKIFGRAGESNLENIPNNIQLLIQVYFDTQFSGSKNLTIITDQPVALGNKWAFNNCTFRASGSYLVKISRFD